MRLSNGSIVGSFGAQYSVAEILGAVPPQKSRPHDNVQVSSLWNMCLYKNSHLAVVPSVIVLPLVQEDTKRNDGDISRHQRSGKKSPVRFLGMFH